MFVAAHLGSRVWGGAERAVSNLLRGLQGRGHRVLLYCGDPRVAEGARGVGVPIVLVELGGDIAVHHAVRFARLLRRDRPDVLIAGTFKKLWLLALAARLSGVRRVVARIGLESDTPRSAKYRWVMRRWVESIVLTSDAPRAEYARAMPELTRDRVVTIRTGVAPRHATRTREAMRLELGIAPDARVIGAVARLARQKRFDRLLEALAALPSDVRCVLAGDGPLREELARRAETLGVGERVHFLGARDDVGNVLVALDVFVVSSDKEGLANAMLEALFLGIPVVSTDVSGARDALEPLEDGSRPGLIAERDAGALARAIRRLLDDPDERRRMSESAMRRARERFGFDRMIEQWEALLARGTGAMT